MNVFTRAARLYEKQLENDDPTWTPLPHQVPPDELAELKLYVWLMMGGRGMGKTEGIGRYFSRYMHRHPGTRASIIAPTLGDARQSCVYGDSGLAQFDDKMTIVKSPDFELRWPNGSKAHIFGAHSPEDVERLRAGGNRHLVWAEELAAWRHLQDAWDQMEFGLRLGAHPHVVASTTPKNRPLIRELVERDDVVITRGHTNDNPHLHEKVRERLIARYGGTRLGRQELAGEILDDNENALWDSNRIEELRIPDADWVRWRPDLARIVVGVDPAVTANQSSDDTGIVTAGKIRGRCICGDGEDHAFVLSDDTQSAARPEKWALKAVQVYGDFSADAIIGEVNNGGDLVESVIRNVEGGRHVNYRAVRASRGKKIRAEPVSALYEQGKVHHIGYWPELEDQMTTWEPGFTKDSPDRVDALVWALSSLFDMNTQPATSSQARDHRLRGRR